LYTSANPPQTSLKRLPNAVDLAMNLLLSRSANAGESQPIANLTPRISANTTVSSKKTKFASEDCFSVKIHVM